MPIAAQRIVGLARASLRTDTGINSASNAVIAVNRGSLANRNTSIFSINTSINSTGVVVIAQHFAPFATWSKQVSVLLVGMKSIFVHSNCVEIPGLSSGGDMAYLNLVPYCLGRAENDADENEKQLHLQFGLQSIAELSQVEL